MEQALATGDWRASLRDMILNNAPFWGGEYAVARRYFGTDLRSDEGDVRWLRLQMYKEWTGAGAYGERGITVNNLVRRASEGLDRIAEQGYLDGIEEVGGLLNFATDEFNHYAILCRVYRNLVKDNRLSIEEMGDMPHGNTLVELRYKMREDRLGNIAVDLSEGGGLGLYFAVRDAFADQGELSENDRHILDFANATVEDETQHMAWRFQKLVEAGLEPDELRQVDEHLQTICTQKLRERNQQFSDAFSDDDLQELMRDTQSAHRYAREHLGFLGERFGFSL